MKFILVLSFFFLSGCSYRNVEFVKSEASSFLSKSGYEIISYQGYQGYGILESRCGGLVWYTVKRNESHVLYNLALCKWSNEIHIYNLKALNAIEGK